MADDTVFTTARLLARRWRDSDLAGLIEVYGDAEAMRWVGDGRPLTRERCEQWLLVTRDNYVKRGYGMFTLEAAADRELVGFAGIVHPGGQQRGALRDNDDGSQTQLFGWPRA